MLTAVVGPTILTNACSEGGDGGGATGIKGAQLEAGGEQQVPRYSRDDNAGEEIHGESQCCVVVSDPATVPPLRDPALKNRPREKAGPLRSG